jgi:hypothetical protein
MRFSRDPTEALKAQRLLTAVSDAPSSFGLDFLGCHFEPEHT